jgi:hypothetical protein
MTRAAMRNKSLMKHFISVAVLVMLALAVRFWLFSRFSLDVAFHATYYVISLRTIVFWLLMGTAAVWFIIAAWKSGRV